MADVAVSSAPPEPQASGAQNQPETSKPVLKHTGDTFFDFLEGPSLNPKLIMPETASISESDSDGHVPKPVPPKDARPEKSILSKARRLSVSNHDRHVQFDLPPADPVARPRNPSMYRYGSKGSPRYHSITELHQLYLTKCNTLKIRPLRRLLAQLESAADHEVQLRSIDISETPSMEPGHWDALCDLISHDGFLTSLKVDNCNLTDQSMGQLASALCRYRTIESLSIGNNPNVKQVGLSALTMVLNQCRRFRELNLSGLQLNKKTTQALCKAFANGTLQSLILNNCGLKDRTVLEALVQGIAKAPSIRTLQLQSNAINEQGARLLASMLQSPSCGLTWLDLRSNALSERGAQHLAEGLAQNSSLHSLLLWRNSIGPTGLAALAGALRLNNTLSTLDVSYNECCNEQSVHQLQDSLLANHTLTSLCLVFTGLDAEGVIALAEALTINQTLCHLDLRHNPLTAAGTMALAHALRLNTALTHVMLDPPEEGDEVGKEMVSMVTASCQRNAQNPKATPNTRVYNDHVFHRYIMSDPHQIKDDRPVNIDAARSNVTLLNEMLNCFDPQKDNIDENEVLQEALSAVMDMHQSIQAACQKEKNEDRLVKLLVLNDDIYKAMQRYDKLVDRSMSEPDSANPQVEDQPGDQEGPSEGTPDSPQEGTREEPPVPSCSHGDPAPADETAPP